MPEVTSSKVEDCEIRAALLESIDKVWTDRYDLVSEGASERTVVARIAFEPESIAQSWSPRWRADVEHNLRRQDEGILKKALYLERRGEGRLRSVYPI